MLHAVIMAGGSGTRFWPASRADCPKQLLDLTGDSTMIQATVQRLDPWIGSERILIVTNQRLVAAIRAQLPQIPPAAVLGEPCKRDTAPCIGLAALWVSRDDPDATMVVMPSDHVITDTAGFRRGIEHAAQLVEVRPERLVTFGINPTYPAESFGYIQCGDVIATESGPATYRVQQFREKPDLATAQEYLETDGYFWNAGIFVWRAQTILDQLAKHEPDMLKHLQTIADAIGTPLFDDVLAEQFPQIEGRSIDYAVMENADEVAVVEAPFDWDDMGSWQAVARLRGVDDAGNTVDGKNLSLETTQSIIRGDDEHLIVTLGIDNLIVVHTPDATLVASRDHEESIRAVVKLLEDKNWREYL